MSGLEVGAAVFGLVVGTIDIIHKSIEIYEAVKDKSGIPKALRKVSDKLPAVENLLGGAKAQYKEGKLDKIDKRTWDDAKQEIEQCKKLCQELQDLLLSAYPEAGSAKAGRVWKGTQTVFSGKSKSAEALFKEISEHLDTLAKQQIINNTALLEDIKSLVEELCPRTTTTSMQNIHGDNFIGDKTQNYNQGTGPMINGASGPITFGGIHVASESTQIYQNTTRDTDDEYHMLSNLRWPDPYVVRNRLMENKDALRLEAIEWIFQDEGRFLGWLNDVDKHLLWIKGGAGKGKTMMTIGITEQILSAGDDSVIVTYFFCQNADSQLNTIAGILKGLILRLIKQQEYLKDSLQRHWDRKNQRFIEDMNVWQTLWDVLLEMLDRCRSRKVYIVIDALDECEDKDMADFLGRVVRRGLRQPRVKWLLTSRPLDSAQQKLLTGSDQVGLSLELNSEHVARGVQAYIAAKILELDRGKNYGENLRLQLITELTLKAEATFLWVSLVCKVLEDIPAEDAIATVNDTPEGLMSLYQQAFEQLEGSNEFQACKHILKVLMLAYRPLHVSELGGLTNDNDEQEAVRRLIDQCSSFVRLRKNIVEFVHQSARDYLGGKDGQSPLDTSTPYGHFELTMSCLFHLNRRLKVNLLDLPRPDSIWTLSDISANSKAQKLLKSLDYAATFWTRHLEGARCSQAHQGVFAKSEVLSQFLHGRFLEWLECLALLRRLRVSVEGLRVLKTISGRIEQDNDVWKFVQEAIRFVLRNYSTIAEWPLQTYSCAIIFTPHTSMIRKQNLKNTPSWLEKLPKVEGTWSPVIQTLFGHSGSVKAVTFSPDSRQLASASNDNTIKLWDATTGELHRTLLGHSSTVNTVAFSHDGTQLASASSDKTIKLWDPTTGELRKTMTGHSSSVTAVAFSPDGRQLASASDGKIIKLWDPTTGELRGELPNVLTGHYHEVKAVAFSRDGTQLASVSSWDGTIKLQDLTTGKLRKTLTGHSFSVTSVAFSHDGTQLASASSWGKTIKVWDANTGELRRTLTRHTGWTNVVTFSPDNRELASASDDNTIKLWDATTGELPRTLLGHSSTVNAVAFSHDGTQLASASFDKTIKLWDPTTGELPMNLASHSGLVTAVTISPDGKQLASASNDKTIRLWDATTCELRRMLTGHFEWANVCGSLDCVSDVAFSPDGRQLASAFYDNTIKLWDTTTGELRRMLMGHSDSVNAVTFSPDGRQLATASNDNTIKLWDVTTGELHRTLRGHSGSVKAVAFSPDGKQLASASDDKTIKLWDVTVVERRKVLKTSRFLQIFGVGSNKPSRTMRSLMNVSSLTYSTDSSYLNTDRGVVELVGMIGDRHDDTIGAETILSVREQWICLDNSPVIWLPLDYVSACFYSYGDVLAIGCKNGQFLRFNIDRLKLRYELKSTLATRGTG